MPSFSWFPSGVKRLSCFLQLAMNGTTLRSLRLLLLLVTTTLPLSAQTLELRSGEVVIGRVLAVDDHTVKLEVTFPDVSVRSIKRSDIQPRSIYALLSARIDQADAKAHLGLARTCKKLGLLALAISESREASRRDAALSPIVDKLIIQLRGQLAGEILQQAEGDYAEDRMGSARMAAHVLKRDYGDTDAATGAKKLMAKIAARVGPQPREISAKEVNKVVAAARRALARTAKKTGATPAHGSMRDQRALQSAVSRLEKAWARIGNLVGPHEEATPEAGRTSVATPADRLSLVQAELRRRLTASYLSLGSIYLERRALPDADDWCNKACALDPENKHLHRLHELILQAKIVSGWGY